MMATFMDELVMSRPKAVLLALGLAAFAAVSACAREAVVFVGAHPDDLAGEVGAALRLRERYDIHVVDFTRGDRGCGEEKFRSGWTKATRTKEEEAVCAAIGAKLHWIDEVDGEAFACREACERMAAVLREVKPRAVITHWPVDIHLDHVMTGAATLKAIKLAGIDPEIYFHEQDHQSRAFTPTVYVDVTGVEAEKERIIRLYACQNGERIALNKRLAGDFRGRSGLRPASFCEAYCAYPGSVKGLGVLAGLSASNEPAKAL